MASTMVVPWTSFEELMERAQHRARRDLAVCLDELEVQLAEDLGAITARTMLLEARRAYARQDCAALHHELDALEPELSKYGLQAAGPCLEILNTLCPDEPAV